MTNIVSYGANPSDFLYYEGSNDGSAVQFDAANIGSCSVAGMSGTVLAVAYQDGTDGNLIAASVSDTTPSFGTKVQVTSNSVGDVDVCALTSTSGLMIYEDSTDTDWMVAGFTLSGTAVTAGTPVQVDTTVGTGKPNINPIDTTTALAVWYSGSAAKAAAISLSGTTPTVGTPVTTNAAATGGVSCAALSTSLGVAAFIDDADTNIPKVVAFTISGTTLGTPGSETTVGTGGSGSDTAVIPLTATTAAVLSNNTTDDTIEYSLISVSGTTVTENYRGVLGKQGVPGGIFVDTISDVTALLNPITSSEGGLMGVKRNPSFTSNIVFGKQDQTMNITASNSDVCLLSKSKAAVVYDDGASGGKVIVTKVR